jgi:hypothetical protein
LAHRLYSLTSFCNSSTDLKNAIEVLINQAAKAPSKKSDGNV